MIKVIKAMLILFCIFLVTAGCSDNRGNDSGGNNNDISAITETDLYGSYRGTVTVMGTEYNMCLDVGPDTIYFRSTPMSKKYTNIAYTRADDGTWSFAVFSDYDTEQDGKATCTGSFAVSDAAKTCKATIVSMDVTTDTLTMGDTCSGHKL